MRSGKKAGGGGGGGGKEEVEGVEELGSRSRVGWAEEQEGVERGAGGKGRVRGPVRRGLAISLP